jgi:drug/metabolite transporter (DMT)-like permease
VLALVTFFWSFSFPLMKQWQADAHAAGLEAGLGTFTVIGLRAVLALFILAGFRRDLFFKPTLCEHLMGAGIGCLYFVGTVPQVLGLASISPALSAFITNLTSAWVPVLVFLCFRTRITVLNLLGLAVALGGIAVLAGIDQEGQWGLGVGEALTVICSVVFAVYIVAVDRWGKRAEPAHFTVALLATAAVLSIGSGLIEATRGPGLVDWLARSGAVLRQPRVLGTVAILTVFCTVLAFHLMNVYQPRVPASRAALIYLLEPVFTAVVSILAGYDEPTIRLAIGGAMVLGGNLLAEQSLWGWLKRGTVSGPES